MASFTPQEIEQFLQQFFDVVGARQYIGARYVPVFGRGEGTSVDWDGGEDAYEPLSIVYWRGDTYTSRRYVPAGIDIEDQDYWVITGRYNAQVEQYRQEVLSFQGQIDAIRTDLEDDYVPFPDGIQHPKYGTVGQVLATLADGTTEWADPVVPSDAQAEAVITEWLDDHPEATTTVQDGAITTAKLHDGAVTDAKLAANGVKLLASKLKDAICAGEYDATATYSAGDYVWHNDILYSAKFALGPEAWTGGHWASTPAVTGISDAVRQVCALYDPSVTYAVGEYCRWTNNALLRCKATTSGESEPTLAKWDVVTLDVMNELVSQFGGSISEIAAAMAQMGYVLPSFYVNGGISSSGADVSTFTYRIRSQVITFDSEMRIRMLDGFTAYVWAYPTGQSAYVVMNANASGVIPAGVPVKIVIRRVTEDTGETADIALFASKIVLTRTDSSKDAITTAADDIRLRRFENVEYVDLTNDMTTISAYSSAAAGFDYDVHTPGHIKSVMAQTNPGATTSEFRMWIATPITLASTQEFEVVMYLPDASLITQLSLRTQTAGFNKTVTPALHDGWNVVRFPTEGAGTIDYTADVTVLRFLLYHAANTDTTVYVGGITQVKPAYANVIVIDDGPYYTFYDQAYPLLKNIGVPVSWAIDPMMLDDVSETDRHLINENELELLAYDGISEFSYHNYDGTLMSSATAAQALADTVKCQRYLRQHGLEPQRPWRAAWFQNSCPNHGLADLEVEASASYDGTSGISLYPFADPHNIPRIAIQGRTESYFDDLFAKLKNHHCTVLFYTHGVSSGDKDISTTMLSYFVSKLSTGISEGWLNPTTYNRLVSLYKEI